MGVRNSVLVGLLVILKAGELVLCTKRKMD